MALPKQQIDSIISQLSKFGDDGVAFDSWMDAVTPHVRSHGHVGAFRTTARGLWLTNNKKGVEKLVRDLLEAPSIAEQAAMTQGEQVGDMAERAFYSFLTRMGICKGDTLTVHSADGDIIPLSFHDDRLPERPKKKVPKPAKKAAAPKSPLKEALADIDKTLDKIVEAPEPPKKKKATRKPRKKKDDNA